MSDGWTYSSGGRGSLIAKLELRGERLKDEAVDVMEKTVNQGGGLQQDVLEEKTTKTGLARVRSGRGRFAGRHVSGEMEGSVEYHVDIEQHSKHDLTVIGRWGWPNPEDYFLEQDYGVNDGEGSLDGVGHVPAAHSLVTSFVETREVFRARVIAAAGKGSGGF